MIPELQYGNVTVPLAQSLAVARASVRSPFTGTGERQDWGGRWWRYDIRVVAEKADDATQLAAFMVRAAEAGRFIFRDPDAKRADDFGAPVVTGGSQTGATLAVAGLNPSITLSAGSFLSLGAQDQLRLHMILVNVEVAIDGTATIPIAPALRYSPVDGAPVELNNPGVLLEVEGHLPKRIGKGIYEYSFSAREYL